jgi:hypothetical protein
MFWFKSKKITVDAFCVVPGVVDYCPIEPASKFLPNWWKSLDASYEIYNEKFNVNHRKSTLKRCDSFVALYKKGFILPLWTDMQVQTNENSYGCMFSDNSTDVVSHDRKQFDSPTFSNLLHMKIISPWVLQEKTGCEFSWNLPWWNNVEQRNDFYVLPGVIEFKYQHATNINMFINNTPRNFMIAAGTPLVHMIPISDKDVEVKCHYLPQQEYNKKFHKTTHQLKFIGAYKERKKISKSKESKCPFGFSK